MKLTELISDNKKLALAFLCGLYGSSGPLVWALTASSLLQHPPITESIAELAVFSLTMPAVASIMWLPMLISFIPLSLGDDSTCSIVCMLPALSAMIVNGVIWYLIYAKSRFSLFKPRALNAAVWIILLAVSAAYAATTLPITAYHQTPSNPECYDPYDYTLLYMPLSVISVYGDCEPNTYVNTSEPAKLAISLILTTLYWWITASVLSAIINFIYARIGALTKKSGAG
ncbi:MAG: hypothetical protein NTU61_02125 [Candidatus Altiarchaeota archaeon]|nr:hypothetical protein [Candidatus Altiarchaeota archaeon]